MALPDVTESDLGEVECRKAAVVLSLLVHICDIDLAQDGRISRINL